MTTQSFTLPPELWSLIFHWATYSRLREYYDIEPDVFEPYSQSSVIASEKTAEVLSVKRTLVLVCSSWKVLATELLYEDIAVNHGWQTLAETLEASKKSCPPGIGKHVRRICISRSCAQQGVDVPLITLRILQCCPNVRTLSKYPDGAINQFSATPTFMFPPTADGTKIFVPSLRRLDWGGEVRTVLPGFLRHAVGLQVLSLGGEPQWSHGHPLHLPNLHTLSFKLTMLYGADIRAFFDFLLFSSFPSLRRLILGTLPDPKIGRMIWAKYGTTLKAIELRGNLKFLLEDYVTPLLQQCAELESLNFYVFFTHLFPGARHTTLKHVSLHALINLMRDEDGDWKWRCLHAHLAELTGPSFPAMERITLHGDWHPLVSDSRFTPLCHMIRSRRIALESADGSIDALMS